MAANRPSVYDNQFFNAGTPAAGFKLYTYDSGTSTPKATYTDQAGTIPNTNPITLDAQGMCELWLGTGEYTLALYTGLIGSGGALVKTWDDVSGASSAGDIASASDATKGAGMVAFLASLVYAAGTVGYWLKTLVAWVQTGVGAVVRSLADRALGTVELLDFVPTNLHASIADGTIATNLAPYLRLAIDPRTGPITVMLPIGTVYATELVYAGKNGVRIKGQGPAVSKYKYVNAAGGIVFAGDADTTASLAQYESCALEDFEVISSGTPGTDPAIVVDLSSFSYSHFNIEIQTRRVNAVLYYGQGNAGVAPYYNHIESTGLFGHTDYAQTAFQFRGGTFSGGSNGPNGNMIGPITRAASLGTLFDIRVGQGNMFSQIGAESIGGTYIVLGGNAAVDTGTSTGSNTGTTLNDTGAAWASSAFVNGAVQITAGTGQGQVRTIRTNTGTVLTLNEPWTSTIPDATSEYAIYEGKALKNKFINIRGEGLDSENPDFIYAFPGSDGTEVMQVSVESLGAGELVKDFSGSVKNRWFGDKVIVTHVFTTPGASANINAFPRAGALGGLRPAGEYFLEWVKVEVDGTSHGGTANVVVDAGGGAVGAGDQSLGASVINGESQAVALSRGRVVHVGTNTSIHINLQTDASFDVGRSVIVALCFSLVQA